jgi:hypothetical protein
VVAGLVVVVRLVLGVSHGGGAEAARRCLEMERSGIQTLSPWRGGG